MTIVNVTIKKSYLKILIHIARLQFILSLFCSHADAGWNPMASLLPEGPLFILSHLCSGAVFPGSFWMPGDGSTSHTHWGHWSINRYISCNSTNWPTEISLKWPITTQLPSLSHLSSYLHLVECFSSYSYRDLYYSIQVIVS